MSRSKLPASVRKFLRKEKARIRREIFDPRAAGERIHELIQKFHGNVKGGIINESRA